MSTDTIHGPVAEPPTPRLGRTRRTHRRGLPAVLVSIAVVLAVGLTGLLVYRRQVVSYLTHWKGSPTHTEPYVPFDPPPALHLAAAGDIGDSGKRLTATAATMGTIGAENV